MFACVCAWVQSHSLGSFLACDEETSAAEAAAAAPARCQASKNMPQRIKA